MPSASISSTHISSASISSTKRLNLLFPQWQGSGNIGLYKSVKLLRQSLYPETPFVEVPVSSTYSLSTMISTHLLHLPAVIFMECLCELCWVKARQKF
ncbi:MAG: hypothetical protein AAFQ63_16805 [Cyanobacteria bacterium J06621_11]